MATHTEYSGNTQPPRELADYLITEHCHMRIGLDDRPIRKELVKRAIRDGRLEANLVEDPESDAWRFRLDVEGCEVVVAAVTERHAHRQSERHEAVILTAYVDVCSADTAFKSDVWSFDDVHRAAALQYLGGDRELPSELPPNEIHIPSRILVGGHRVIFKHGKDTAHCPDCGRVSESKYTFQDARCVK